MADIVSFALSHLPGASGGAAHQRDWTNQELSDFYRAVAMLNQAGIAVHTDRGVTDEGDPWVVFCRMDGEVFIHFCRMEGRYLLDSPALSAPLRGSSFSGLIDRFIDRAAVAAAPNVVAFRQSKVLLHPAALLTILVWTLYVSSSHNGTPLQASETLPDDLMAALHHGDDATAAAPEAPASKPAETRFSDSLPGEKSLIRLFGQLEVQMHGQAANIAAVQLMAAISMLALGTHDFDQGAPLAGVSLTEDIKPVPVTPVIEHHVEKVVIDTPHDTPAHDTASLVVAEVAAAEPVTLTLAVHTADMALPIFTLIPQSIHEEFVPEMVAHGATLAVLPLAKVTAAPAPAAQPPQLAQVSEKVNFANLQNYSIDGRDFVSTIDLRTNDAFVLTLDKAEPNADPSTESNAVPSAVLTLEAPQLDGNQPLAHMAKYDDAARDFVEFFITHGGDVELIASKNEVMLIDMTAFDETTDHAYARSWVLGDGGIVSTIGHFDMFADFALVSA